jgi:hypothetical protein
LRAGVAFPSGVAFYAVHIFAATDKVRKPLDAHERIARKSAVPAKGDFLMAIGFLPYGKETQYCVRMAHDNKAGALVIIDSQFSPLARFASVVLVVREGQCLWLSLLDEHHLPVPGIVHFFGLQARAESGGNHG